MMRLCLIFPLVLAACAGPFRGPDRPASDIDPQAQVPAGPFAAIRPAARPAGGEPALQAGPPATGALGVTIASLGNAAQPGLWLETPLVRQRGAGQVGYGGKTVTADLIPIPGPATAGSRASLQLMQALGAPLTGLPEFRVSR